VDRLRRLAPEPVRILDRARVRLLVVGAHSRPPSTPDVETNACCQELCAATIPAPIPLPGPLRGPRLLGNLSGRAILAHSRTDGSRSRPR
jgi:hypothetical protein